MALLTCIKCRESYSDTLNGCPHCGFIPQIFLCPECGSVHGPGDLCCRNCGFQLNGSRIIADDAAIAGALEKLGGELEKVTGLRQAEKLFDASLDLPQITKLFIELKKRSLCTETDVYTIGYAKKQLERMLEC